LNLEQAERKIIERALRQSNGQPFDRFLVFPAIQPLEMIGQHQDILSPLTQRWYGYLYGIEEQAERKIIERALRQSNGNMSYAAELLGITRFSLYRKASV